MTRFLLDTNIISDILKPSPSPRLAEWMAAQRDADLFIAALTIAELRRGILQKPAGRKREALEKWFFGPEGPQQLFQGRILPFETEAALVWARLMAEGFSRGRPRSGLDMIVAAVAEVGDCIVITDNEKDFYGLKFLNPMREGSC